MFLLRRIVLIAMLAVAGSGSLPLWLHQSLHHSGCHQSLCASGESDETQAKASCGCVHASDKSSCPAESTGESRTQLGAQHSDHHCAACFQLSQISSPISCAPAGSSPLVTDWTRGTTYLSWNVRVPCAYPPRGPPSDLPSEL